MKKMLFRCFAGVMAVCMTMSVSAVGAGEEFIFEYDQKDIIVLGDINFQNAQIVVKNINGEEIIVPRNLLCIFGHNLERTTVYEIIHRYYSTSPKCHSNVYDVYYCTRSCGYSVGTLIRKDRIYCCA